MKVNDTLIGLVMLLLALAVLWHVSDFPPVPGQPYGSALFPSLAAGGLAIASLLLAIQGWRSGNATARPAGDSADNSAAESPAKSAGPRLLPVALVVGAIVFYILFADWLGFIVCGVILLCVLMAVFRVRPILIVPIAIAATLIIHTGFYQFLRVPLPWGVLQPLAW